MVGMMGGGGGTESLSMDTMVEFFRDPKKMTDLFDRWKQERAKHDEHLRKAMAGIQEAEKKSREIMDAVNAEVGKLRSDAQVEAGEIRRTAQADADALRAAAEEATNKARQHEASARAREEAARQRVQDVERRAEMVTKLQDEAKAKIAEVEDMKAKLKALVG